MANYQKHTRIGSTLFKSVVALARGVTILASSVSVSVQKEEEALISAFEADLSGIQHPVFRSYLLIMFHSLL